jgi:hypothetical protein
LSRRIVREVALEHVIAASHADLGAEDEDGTRWEVHVAEVAELSNVIVLAVGVW